MHSGHRSLYYVYKMLLSILVTLLRPRTRTTRDRHPDTRCRQRNLAAPPAFHRRARSQAAGRRGTLLGEIYEAATA